MPSIVTAIVLNYRTPKETLRCVQALLKQSIAAQMEILVVDNHSEDDSIQFLRNRLREFSGVTLLESNRNCGYGRGNTLGIDRARGKYLLIINPDNELEPTGLATMVNAMEEEPSIGILAPQLVHGDGTIRDSYRTFPTMIDVFIKRTILRPFFPERMQRYLQHDQNPDQVRDVDWVAGACFLMRRDLYETIGGFDPRFFLFFEDTDLCRRVWKEGKQVVYFPLVKATDRKHRLSEGGLFSLFTKRTTRIHLASGMKYFWKWNRYKHP